MNGHAVMRGYTDRKAYVWIPSMDKQLYDENGDPIDMDTKTWREIGDENVFDVATGQGGRMYKVEKLQIFEQVVDEDIDKCLNKQEMEQTKKDLITTKGLLNDEIAAKERLITKLEQQKEKNLQQLINSK